MVAMGIVTPLATIPSTTKLYVTHSQHAAGQSLTTWAIYACASLLWLGYGLLNCKCVIYVKRSNGDPWNIRMATGSRAISRGVLR